MTQRYLKLIRDKLPGLMSGEQHSSLGEAPSKESLNALLAEKLSEEAAELFEAFHVGDRAQVLSELADLTEVRDRIATQFGITTQDIEKAQAEKRALRGGFDQGITFTQPITPSATRWFEGHHHVLLQFLQTTILQSKRVDLAVSFLMQSGIELLENTFIEALAKGCSIRILTTNYLDVTDPQAQRRLLDMGKNISIKMYDGRGRSFHPKTWLFELHGGRQLAVVGSSNLSRSALVNGVEWNYKVLDSDHGWPMQQAWQIFEDYFQAPESRTVSEILIADYEQNRKPRPIPEEHAPRPAISPNPAQREALVALANMRADGERRAMVVAATGLGKTYLAAFDSLPYRRVLFVAHRDELLTQAEHAFKKLRPDDRTQLLTRGAVIDLSAQLVFAGVRTLASETNQKLIPASHFDYIVVDEFHHAAARSYEALFDKEYSFLLGLTATPFRLDNKDLLALCDSNIAYQINVIDAITAGWLCPFHYRGIYDATDYSKIERRAGKYSIKGLSRALNNQKRNQLALDEYLKTNSKQALGFCTSISHSNSMAQFFTAHGIASMSLNSRSSREERSSAISQLQTGKCRVIFTVDLFNEGVDIPTVELVMFLRPTESVTIFLQQLGRGLRLSQNKTHLNIIDLVGNYKGADFKLPTLIGMQDWNDQDIRKIAQKINTGTLNSELPTGVKIELDDLALQAINAVARQGLASLIVEEYRRIKTELGRRPTLTDMRNNSRYPIKLYRQKFGSWLDFLSSENDLSESENQLKTSHQDFFKEIERASMDKSYRMVVILAMVELGGFLTPVSIQRLANYYRQHFSKPRYKIDLIGTAIYDLANHSDKKLVTHITNHPIKSWLRSSFFRLDAKGQFSYAKKIEDEIHPFEFWVNELAHQRLYEYQQSKSRLVAQHKVVWGIGPSDKPHIHLDRKNSDLPNDGEFHTVEILGKKYLAKFVKIAINVVREASDERNILEDLIRQSHPELSRAALSKLCARIMPIPNDVGYEISFY